MAAAASSSRFATMLHKSNTPKIAIVLIYTLLEWTLIALMLLNGYLSYSIAAFAEFFGLHPPCFLCSHALATSSSSSYEQILCDSHLHELGFGNLRKEEEEEDDEGFRSLLRETSGENFVSGEKLEEKLLFDGKSEGKLVLDEKSNDKLETKLVSGEKSKEKTHPDEKFEEIFSFGEKLEQKSVLDEKSEEFFVFDENSDEILVIDGKSKGNLVLDENARENLHLGEKSVVELVLGDNYEEKLNLDENSKVNVLLKRIDEMDDASLELILRLHREEAEERLIPVDLVDSSTLLATDNGDEFNGNYSVEAEVNCEVSIGSEICDQDEHIDPPIALLRSSESEPTDERVPETPTSVDSFQALQKRIRELGNDSLDGSEIDGSEMQTVDQLKSALKAERNALSALYSELEEERSASSVAANQTMAMITRLQEEKAAMQMEAFQYQRMMEEQSEYDQEALQLLNDLVVKREREKRELEEELEAYRKEETRASSSVSSTDDRNGFGRYVSFATDHLLTLDDSLDDFEDERFAILEQLKALEDKLLSLDDECGHGLNGFGNEKPRSAPRGGKRLLPLFDAVVSAESGDESSPNAIRNRKKLAIAEEVDSVYERLHALEADREFIKQCIGSLKKGDKGMDLLQEILQHLRELRSVQLRVRNAGYALASLSA